MGALSSIKIESSYDIVRRCFLSTSRQPSFVAPPFLALSSPFITTSFVRLPNQKHGQNIVVRPFVGLSCTAHCSKLSPGLWLISGCALKLAVETHLDACNKVPFPPFPLSTERLSDNPKCASTRMAFSSCLRARASLTAALFWFNIGHFLHPHVLMPGFLR